MKLSTKTRYGARILIELARHQGQGALQVSRIAMHQKIPVKYLEQLLRQLKLSGFVNSVRGPKGGHLLAREPETITLGQVVRLFESQHDIVECVSCPDKCDMIEECLVRQAWQKANTALYESLDQVTIADLTLTADAEIPQIR